MRQSGTPEILTPTPPDVANVTHNLRFPNVFPHPGQRIPPVDRGEVVPIIGYFVNNIYTPEVVIGAAQHIVVERGPRLAAETAERLIDVTESEAPYIRGFFGPTLSNRVKLVTQRPRLDRTLREVLPQEDKTDETWRARNRTNIGAIREMGAHYPAIQLLARIGSISRRAVVGNEEHQRKLETVAQATPYALAAYGKYLRELNP